ncbi:MAG: MIP family channel protein [Actinobacteria bacterium]|nr:MIP family channel protein [Actinomycetota bacterium]
MADQAMRRPLLATTTGACAAEVIGTFMFTFSGTATVLAVHKLSKTTGGFTAVSDVAIAIAFAFGVVAAVYMVARVSGAHINPAVTVALAAVGKFPWRMVPAYVVSQFIGGLLAGLMNWFMFGNTLRESLILGSTHPGIGIAWWTACFTEFVITALLMIVVMATAVYERAPGGSTPAGLAIGLWVGAAIFLALPISGGSLNPARTLGPDIIALNFPFWWIYIVGPVLGAAFGAALWEFVLSRGRKEAVEAVGSDTHEDQEHRRAA